MGRQTERGKESYQGIAFTALLQESAGVRSHFPAPFGVFDQRVPMPGFDNLFIE
jgi:hypothetical protein